MNKHMKLGIVIAPFLAIGGYVASDYYMKYKAENERYHQINLQGECNMSQEKCVINGSGLSLELRNVNGITEIKSNYPLDSAAIALVDKNQEKPQNLQPDAEKKYWTIPLTSYVSQGLKSYRIRMIVTANDHIFFSEFDNASSP